jgi:uncharacterized protein (DUF2267 family)
MSATGLDVFDKTLQTTNTWLNEIMETVGPVRQVAWHALGAVLRTLRDQLTPGLSAHLGAMPPLLVRGLYYDQWQPAGKQLKLRNVDEFLGHVEPGLRDIRPVNVRDETWAVFHVIDHYVEPNQITSVRDALSKPVRALWPKATAVKHRGPARRLEVRRNPSRHDRRT